MRDPSTDARTALEDAAAPGRRVHEQRDAVRHVVLFQFSVLSFRFSAFSMLKLTTEN